MTDGADIGGDFLARLAIAPGGRLHQHALVINQADGQTIKFELCHVIPRRRFCREPQAFAHALVERLRAARLGIGLGLDAAHGHTVRNLGERFQGGPPHALGRRVGHPQVREGRLQCLQALEQSVVFGVRQLGRIEHVIEVRMTV